MTRLKDEYIKSSGSESEMISIVIIILLLVLNAFFVAAEFALVKARGLRIESLAASGNSAAKLTVRIQKNLEAYLAACQLGITMASLGLGWIGEPAVASLLKPLFHVVGISESLTHTISFILGFLIFSSLHIVVGEQVPKTFAIRRAEQVSLLIAYPLHLAYLVVWPLNWCLNKTSAVILSWFNVAEATHGDVFTDEELKHLVSASHEHGNLEQQKATMLRNLFEFDQNSVQRVMIPRHAICTLDVAQDAQVNRRTVFASGHSRFPLIDSNKGNQILGVILVKTLHQAISEPTDDAIDPWATLKTYCRPALVIPESQKTASLFDLMREQRNHLALVVDEYGKLSGIVTLEDLLEEIVGDIEDETDLPSPANMITRTGNDAWTVDGLAKLTSLERHFDIEFPDDIDANSMSGLIMERLRHMPKEGSSITECGYQFTILGIVESRVGTVKITSVIGPPSPYDNTRIKTS